MQIDNIASCEATPARADFTADLVQLDAAVSYLARRVIERRNTYPILSNIVIDARPGGEVILTATDCDIWASVTVRRASCESPGRFTVSGHALADMLAKARKTKGAGQLVRMIEGENRAALVFGSNRYNLPALPADDFPMPPICDDTLSHSFTVPAGRFLADLAALAPCQSTEESRYYLNGVALQVRELAGRERFAAVATDGHSMGVASRPLPDGAAGLPDMILPNKATAALRHAGKLDKAEALQLDYAPNRVGGLLAITIGAVRIVAKLIDGDFPDWQTPAVWGRATPTGDALAMFPELLPGAPAKVLETLSKAAGGQVDWQDGEGALLGTVRGDDGFAFVAMKGAGKACARKGFDYEMNGREEAKAYLLALVEARGLPLPADIQAAGEAIEAGGLSDRYGNFHGAKVRLIEGGGKVYGLTVEGEIYRQGWGELVQDWEALVEHEIWHPAGYEPIEGSYSLLMPPEGPALEYASEITGPDGVAYPVAMDDSSIHLSKDQVRALAGEADTRTVKVRTADGQEAFVHAVAWEGPGRFLCICKPNGRDIERGIGSAMYVDREAVIWTSEGGAIADATPAAPEPVQAQEQPLAPAIPAPEPVNALSEAQEPEIEPVELSDDSVKLPEEAAPVLAEAMRAMMARLDAIEATLSADKGAIEEQAPAGRPARSRAHERAVRRAWAERQARRGAQGGMAIHARRIDTLETELRLAKDEQALDKQALGEAYARAEQFARRGNQHRERRLASVKRARRMLAEVREDRDRARKHRAKWEGLARGQFAKRAAMEKSEAAAVQAANVARAELAKLKRDMADPEQPERASDIARLMQERDTARNALAAVQARADRQKEALDTLAGNFEAMALRMAKAEAAVRKAGLIEAA
jgi:DNA polymerase III sliding clamp (beta) subunit (PCNA family)